jgi:hypothetical protein
MKDQAASLGQAVSVFVTERAPAVKRQPVAARGKPAVRALAAVEG